MRALHPEKNSSPTIFFCRMLPRADWHSNEASNHGNRVARGGPPVLTRRAHAESAAILVSTGPSKTRFARAVLSQLERSEKKYVTRIIQHCHSEPEKQNGAAHIRNGTVTRIIAGPEKSFTERVRVRQQGVSSAQDR